MHGIALRKRIRPLAGSLQTRLRCQVYGAFNSAQATENRLVIFKESFSEDMAPVA
jgi:hypothetical protein